MSKPWPKVRLGDILVERKIRAGSFNADELPLLGVNNLIGLHRTDNPRIADMSRYLRVEQHWFAYNPMRINVGSIGWAKREDLVGVISPDYVVFSCTDKIAPILIHLFLKSAVGLQAINLQTAGSVRERLYFKSLAQVEIPLPPLAEQRRIVARIEELFAKIAEARGLRHQAAKEAEALITNHMGLVFSRLGEQYTPRVFGSFLPHVTSGPRNWAKHYEASGLRFYRAQDIGPAGAVIDDSKIYITPPPGEQGRNAMLCPNDLMLVITGATVGRVAVFLEGMEPGFVSQHVAICRLLSKDVLSRFALWGLRSPLGQTQLLGQRYGQGKPGLNLTNIRSLYLPFPPLSEQRQIVADLDAMQAQVDALKQMQTETVAELDALLPAILDRAFKGEL